MPPSPGGRKEGEETGEHDQSPHHHPQGSRARAPALARAAIKQPARLDGAGPRAAAAQQGPGHRKGSPRGSPGRASLAHPAPSKTADGRKDHRIGKTGRPRRDLGHRFEHDPRPRGKAEQGPLAHPRTPQKRTQRSPKPPPKPGSGASRVLVARLHHGPPSLAQHSPGGHGAQGRRQAQWRKGTIERLRGPFVPWKAMLTMLCCGVEKGPRDRNSRFFKCLAIGW